MANIWLAQKGVLKLHQGCGGLVRWVEAFDRPCAGWTGECVRCGDTNLPRECIIPVDLPDGLRVTDVELPSEFTFQWDESATWDENQRRVKAALEVEG